MQHTAALAVKPTGAFSIGFEDTVPGLLAEVDPLLVSPFGMSVTITPNSTEGDIEAFQILVDKLDVLAASGVVRIEFRRSILLRRGARIGVVRFTRVL